MGASRDVAKSLFLQQEMTGTLSIGTGVTTALGAVPDTHPKRKRRCPRCKTLFSPKCKCPNVKESWQAGGWVADDQPEFPAGQIPPEPDRTTARGYHWVDALLRSSPKGVAKFNFLMRELSRPSNPGDYPFRVRGTDEYAVNSLMDVINQLAPGGADADLIRGWAQQKFATAKRLRASGAEWVDLQPDDAADDDEKEV